MLPKECARTKGQLQVLVHRHILEKRAEIRIGLRTKRVGNGSAGAVVGFDDIQHRHVIRVADAFKPVMLNDRQLIGWDI